MNIEFINRVLQLTNEFRAQNGLLPLTLQSELSTAAQQHAENMALQDFFDHTGIDGSSAQSRGQAAGYDGLVAENIAAGYVTPEEVVQGWINSSGHRENLLDPRAKELGIGFYYLADDTGNVNHQYYWTQLFGWGEQGSDPNPRPDLLLGTDVADTLTGSTERDYFIGKGGSDTLTGGAGGDYFIFTDKNQGVDVIADYSNFEGDVIVFVGQSFMDQLNQGEQPQWDFNTGIVSFGGEQFANIGPYDFTVGANIPSFLFVSDLSGIGLT